MPYRKKAPFRFTLDTIGAPELWIEVCDPWARPGAEFRRIMQADTIMLRAQRDGQRFISQEDEWALHYFDDFVKDSLVAWNLYDPKDEDVPEAERKILPIQPPSWMSDDQKVEFDPFAPLPEDVYWAVLQEVRARLSQPPKSSDQ